MNRVLVIGFLVGFGTMLSGCTSDASKYDVNSPCVANVSGMLLDQPCERRLPIENLEQSGIIGTS